MVSLMAFMNGIQAIIAESPHYQLGHDGRDGLCDCVGLLIGGIRRAGGAWKGVHGSNYAARNAMRELRPITAPGQLSAGWAVYKYREPGQDGYSLPEKYIAGGDLRDYYHVGVVLSVSPLRIAHCTSWAGGGGIKIDTALGKWRVAGPMKMVSAEEKEERTMPMGKMTVTAQSGTTVNLRSAKNTGSDATIIERVKVGTLVEVLDTSGDWSKIQTPAGKVGYMKTAFLAAPNAPSPAVTDTVTLTISREAAEYLLEVLKGGLANV